MIEITNVELKDNIRIVASLPTADQTEIDLTKYIGQTCEVTGHWRQVDNNCFAEGEIQVNLNGEGVVILNDGEYEIAS